MFAVEVQDSQSRVVPITHNGVQFRVTGAGKLIGVGNGHPTDHDSDKGTIRKAFSGYCMGLVQSAKRNITVEATSPGIAPGTVTISAKSATLRPQVPVWEREVPVGPGVTGLWRPIPGGGLPEPLVFFVGGSNSVFTLRQDGSNLTGSVEGLGGGFFGGNDTPIPLSEGKVEGMNISFKAENNTYTGTLNGDQIELQHSVRMPVHMPQPAEAAPGGPVIGPPPDGSDPSIGDLGHFPSSLPVMLHRVNR